MRCHKILIIAGFLVIWTFVFYYFMLRNSVDFPYPEDNYRRKEMSKKIEHQVKQELKKSEKLTDAVLQYLKINFPSENSNKKVETETSQPKDQGPQLQLVGVVPLTDKEQQTIMSLVEPPGQEQNNLELPHVESTIIHLKDHQPVIPILVLACNRVSIANCLDNLIQYRPNAEQFPIIVSQDCGDEATRNVILSYGPQLTLVEQPDQSDIFVPPREKKFKGYYKISRHYSWALNYTFSQGYEYVVIVEDDLNVAPDFYEYFLGTHHLLKEDPSLWCISAWNDNGKAKFIDVSRPQLLYRTDFFPGLGWMLTKNLWQELSVKWPKSFWDDWIRHPEQRKDRVCIRPEISRTRTFGKIGVSNEEFVPFTQMNLSYLLKDNYDKTFLNTVYTLPIVTYDELRRRLISKDGPVRIQYVSREQYKRITKMLGLMDDFKSGVPRTAYHGVVSFFYEKRRVYLAPNLNWKGYDLSWS
uniref:Alpha-1,3-mannosyl-glycoprotein 2-beta-N-acetylglucosaminyltransferase n=1 Tax=Glossina brevipalpis TaxID=37001 RepID=A0A1A9WMY1_9MUSC